MQRSKIVKKNNFKKNFLKKFLNFFKKNKNENSLEEVIKNFLNKRIKNKLPLKIDEDQIKFSVDISSFKNLKKSENLYGFFENDGKSKFFRGKLSTYSTLLI